MGTGRGRARRGRSFKSKKRAIVETQAEAAERAEVKGAG
jgi:hypothetical protein